MPTSFKTKKQIKIISQTPPEERVLCTECGGLQAMSQTSIRLDCPVCNGTGYENFFKTVIGMATVRPGAITRWNSVQGKLDFLGEVGIKLDYRYKDILDTASWIELDDIQWKFSFLSTPGEAMGQKRIRLALSRK